MAWHMCVWTRLCKWFSVLVLIPTACSLTSRIDLFLVCAGVDVMFFFVIQKTKPTQHSVQVLRSTGLVPHFLACRSQVTACPPHSGIS